MHLHSPAPSPAVLVVDDEEHLRSMLGEALLVAVRAEPPAGVTVFTAAHGGEALQIFHEHQGRIDVLVTDMMMPYMDGHELARRIIALKPEVNVIFMSGFSSAIFQKNDFPNARFLQKPFPLEALKSALFELLHVQENP